MFNAKMPPDNELPTTRQLIRSTIIAFLAAIAILITIVLPAEYGIDPTGIGRAIGLAEMGEIKQQLAEEAEADRLLKQEAPEPQSGMIPAIVDDLVALVLPSVAHAQDAMDRSDEMSLTLAPGAGAEIKLTMVQGARVTFSWTANGSRANFDMHGDGGGQSISYQRGRGIRDQEGVLEAAFDGKHGWFWRNRTDADVTITLRTSGAYTDITRVM